jgi:recombination protein RecT
MTEPAREPQKVQPAATPPSTTTPPQTQPVVPVKADGKKPIDVIQDELFRRKQIFLSIMPDRAMLERFMQIMVSRVGRDTKLIRCHPVTVARAFTHCAELGLDPSPALGYVAFIARWNKDLPDFYEKGKRGSYELTVQTTYKGFCQLMYQSGSISSIEGAAVYAKDVLVYEQGLTPILRHVPTNDPDPGTIVGAWALIRFKDKDAVPHAEYLPAWRINKVRDESGPKDREGRITGPWSTWPDEMATKTVLRHLAKKVPFAVQAQRAAALEEAEERGEEMGAFDDHLPGIEGNGGGADQTKSDRLAGQIKGRVGAASPQVSAGTGAESVQPAQTAPGPVPGSEAPTSSPISDEEAALIRQQEEAQARLQFGDPPPGR